MLIAFIANLAAAGLMVFPAVVTLMALRRGPLTGVMLVMLLIAGATTLAGWTTGLSISLGFGGLGLALWYFGKRPIRLEVLFAGLASAFILGTAGVHFLGSALAGVDPLDASFALVGQIRASFNAYLELLKQSGGAEQLPRIQALEAARGLWVWTFFRLSPSLLVVSAVGLVLVNVLLVKRVLPALLGLRLNRWRAPDTAIWILLIPGLGLLPYVIARMTSWNQNAVQMLFFTSLNLVIVALLPYLFQGLAVMAFFLERWHLPRMLRGLTYFLVLTQGMIVAVAALGLMEFWVDFRGRSLTAKKEKDKTDEA